MLSRLFRRTRIGGLDDQLVNSYRAFHMSCTLLMGKKKGSNALEPAPRSLSKAQVKRKRLRIQEKAQKQDAVVKKTTGEQVAESLKSPELQKYMEETEKSFAETIKVLSQHELSLHCVKSAPSPSPSSLPPSLLPTQEMMLPDNHKIFNHRTKSVDEIATLDYLRNGCMKGLDKISILCILLLTLMSCFDLCSSWPLM